MAPDMYTPHLDDPEVGDAPETSHPAFVAAAPGWYWNRDGKLALILEQFGDSITPFGSDEGHDILATLQEYYADGGSDAHTVGFVAELITDWGYVPSEIWESNEAEIIEWLDSHPNSITFAHGEIDAYIAAACGQFKISGWIHPALKFWAERALALLEFVIDGWEQQKFGAAPGRYELRLKTLRAILAAAPEPPKQFQLEMYAGS